MDYEFGMEMSFIVTTADMLEIAASGGNGSEYVDIVGLMENAAKELREKDAEIERLREYERLVKFIANDYIELSYEKAQCQRDDWKKRCIALQQKESE